MERTGEVSCSYDSSSSIMTAVWRIPHYRNAVNQLKSPTFGSSSGCQCFPDDGPGYDYNWSMVIHPHGSRRAYSGFVSLYLYNEDDLPALDSSTSSHASASSSSAAGTITGSHRGLPVIKMTMKVMRMYDEMASAYKQTHSKKVFHSGTGGFGFHHFISRHYLLDQESCFLSPTDNSLTITVLIKHLPDPASPPVWKPDFESLTILCKDLGALHEQMIISPESCFPDVSFEIDGRSIHAHKFILSARSPVFAAMFASGMQESKSSVVRLEDVEYDVMQAVVKYVYCGEIEVMPEDQSFVIKMFAAADKYHLKYLRNLCEADIANNVTSDTVSAAMIAGHMHNSDVIKRECFKVLYHFQKDFKYLEDWSEVHRMPDLIDEMMMYWKRMELLKINN